MSKAYASIKRGLEQAIRHQRSLAEFVRRSPLAGAQLDVDRSRDTGRPVKRKRR